MMNWVETLAEYYRLSRTGETQHGLCRRWLPQGEARLAYLRELLEPTAADEGRGGSERGDAARDQPKAMPPSRPLTEIPSAGDGDEEKRRQCDAVE